MKTTVGEVSKPLGRPRTPYSQRDRKIITIRKAIGYLTNLAAGEAHDLISLVKDVMGQLRPDEGMCFVAVDVRKLFTGFGTLNLRMSQLAMIAQMMFENEQLSSTELERLTCIPAPTLRLVKSQLVADHSGQDTLECPRGEVDPDVWDADDEREAGGMEEDEVAGKEVEVAEEEDGVGGLADADTEDIVQIPPCRNQEKGRELAAWLRGVTYVLSGKEKRRLPWGNWATAHETYCREVSEPLSIGAFKFWVHSLRIGLAVFDRYQCEMCGTP